MSCNINLQLNKKVPVIFYNLRGFDSDLIFDELNKFDVKIHDILLNKNLVFIDSMQFMNSSFEKLVENFSDNDFKYLTKEFGCKHLELLKQKDTTPYDYMENLKRFNKEKLPDEKCFYSSVKDGTTGDNGEKLDAHINDEDYWMGKKIWNEFNMKNMSDYHDHYLKRDVFVIS